MKIPTAQYISITNRLVVVQYEDFAGALRTLVWEPTVPEGSAKAGGRRVTPAGQKDMDLIACRCKAKKVPYFDAPATA